MRAFHAPAFALIAAIAVIWGYDKLSVSRIEARPATDWLEITHLNVNNFVVGTNLPLTVTYDRIVKIASDGLWSVAVHHVPDNFVVCYGTGKVRWNLETTIQHAGVDFGWFVNTPCTLDPGQYVIDAKYTAITPEGIAKVLQVPSNVFKVTGGKPQ